MKINPNTQYMCSNNNRGRDFYGFRLPSSFAYGIINGVIFATNGNLKQVYIDGHIRQSMKVYTYTGSQDGSIIGMWKAETHYCDDSDIAYDVTVKFGDKIRTKNAEYKGSVQETRDKINSAIKSAEKEQQRAERMRQRQEGEDQRIFEQAAGMRKSKPYNGIYKDCTHRVRVTTIYEQKVGV